MGIKPEDYEAMRARLAVNTPQRGPKPTAPVGACESEKELHEQILESCRSRGWIVVHSRMDRPTGVAIGTPDFIIFASQKRIFIIEAKSAKGKLTKEQQAMIVWFKLFDQTVHIIRSFSEYCDLICSGRSSSPRPDCSGETPASRPSR